MNVPITNNSLKTACGGVTTQFGDNGVVTQLGDMMPFKGILISSRSEDDLEFEKITVTANEMARSLTYGIATRSRACLRKKRGVYT